MMELKILYEPDPRLHMMAKEVLPGEEVKEYLDAMSVVLVELKGLALAASQVGISKRIVILNLSSFPEKEAKAIAKNENKFCYIINPKILNRSEKTSVMEEGCLSSPGINVNVARSSEIDASYLDEEFSEHKIHATGLLAKCLQHEIDHLNGITILNYVSNFKREILIKKMQRFINEQE